jgi:hypothetical protein
MRAGFASVHADKHPRGRMFAMQIGTQSVSSGKQGGIVKRRRTRNAANTVGTKEGFRHRENCSTTDPNCKNNNPMLGGQGSAPGQKSLARRYRRAGIRIRPLFPLSLCFHGIVLRAIQG